MKALRFTLAFCTLISLAACGDKKSEQAAEKPAGVIPKAQLDAINKAKNVESVLQQGAESESKQIDQQEQ